MPRRNFGKANSTTFRVISRPQADEAEVEDVESISATSESRITGSSSKIKTRRDLEEELFGDAADDGSGWRGRYHAVRDNEGEAAEHGVFFDDTEYDYMQHIRDVNSGDGQGQSFFIEAKLYNKDRRKGKEKQSLEDALRKATLADADDSKGPESRRRSVESDVSVQDQETRSASSPLPANMDPRLREVLEALDDDAYADDEEELFDKIVASGREISKAEFEKLDMTTRARNDDDDDWESDTTERANINSGSITDTSTHTQGLNGSDMPEDPAIPPPQDHQSGEWMQEFQKYKKDQSQPLDSSHAKAFLRDGASSVMTGASTSVLSRIGQDGRRKKKRKGALTSTSGYSMTSSTLARTEQLNILDARFDRIEEEYAEDDGDFDLHDGDDDESVFGIASTNNGRTASVMSARTNTSAMSRASETNVPSLTRQGFEDIMDDFLGGYSMVGKKRVKRGKQQTGLEQLDEVRRDLGPARV